MPALSAAGSRRLVFECQTPSWKEVAAMLLSFVAAVVPVIGVEEGKGGVRALFACSCSAPAASWCQPHTGVAGLDVSAVQRRSESGSSSEPSGLTAFSSITPAAYESVPMR